MIRLDDYPKFKKDINTNVINIHPLLVIESDPKIYISQNEESLYVEEEMVRFQSLNLKVPSIKESLDFESRKIKINNITLNFSNYDDFSDMFDEQYFINAIVRIYWKSQSCTSLSDCMPIYIARIKRTDHDLSNVKFILEDITQSVMHKEIPIATLSPSNAYRTEDIGKTIPMVYGNISSPMFLYEKEGEDLETSLVGICDDVTHVTGGTGRDIDGAFTGHINVYNGDWWKLMSTYEYSDDTSYLGYDSPIYSIQDGIPTFHRIYGDNTSNYSALTYDIGQVTGTRVATKIVPIDFLETDVSGISIGSTGTNLSYSFYYQGESQGYTIGDENKIRGYGHATFPSNAISSVSDVELYANGIYMGEFRNFPQLGGTPNYRFTEHFNPFTSSYNHSIQRMLYDSTYPIDYIKLPDAKKLHDWFTYYYQINGNPNWSVMSFTSQDSNNNTCWTHPLNFNDTLNSMTNYEEDFLTQEDFNLENVEQEFNITLEDGATHNDLYMKNGATFPFPLYRITLINNTTQETSDAGYIIFNKEGFDGVVNSEFSEQNLPEYNNEEFLAVQLWDLLNMHGYGYNDIPRYNLVSQHESLTYQDLDGSNEPFGYYADFFTTQSRVFPTGTFSAGSIKSFFISWNGVSHTVYDNTFETGGLSSQSETSSEVLKPWSPLSIERWVDFGCSDIWYAYFTSDYTDFAGINYKKGLIVPVKHCTAFDNGEILFGGTDFGVGELQATSTNVATIAKHLENAPWDDTRAWNTRIAFQAFLEDINASDIVEGTVSTYFQGNVKGVVTDADYEDLLNVDSSIEVGLSKSDGELTTAEFIQQADDYLLYFDYLTEYVSTADQYTQLEFSLSTTGGSQPSDNFKIPFWNDINDYSSISLHFTCNQAYSSNAGSNLDAFYDLYVKIYLIYLTLRADMENVLSHDFRATTYGRSTPNGQTSAPVVIKDIINKELGIDVDVGSGYEEAVSYLQDFDLTFYVEEKTDSKALIEQICTNSPVIPLFKKERELSFAIIKNSYTDEDVDIVIKSSDVIKSSFTRTKLEQVKTACKVGGFTVDAYDFYGNGDFGYPNGYKKSYYGLDPLNPSDSVLDFEAEYAYSSSSKEKLRNFLLAYYCNQHNILKIKLPLTYINLEVADVIKIDKLINNKKCFGEDYTQEILRNNQTIYPYFIIYSIAKTINSIQIECIQMHDLNKKFELEQGNGDIMRRGVAQPDIADISAFDNYLLGNNPYFTEGQKMAADLNFNGFPDEADLSMLVEIAGGLINYGFDSFGEEVGTTNLVYALNETEEIFSIPPSFTENDDFIHVGAYEGLVPPTLGYYLKIGTEWIKLLNQTHSNNTTTYTIRRGLLTEVDFDATPPYAHTVGEEVVVYNGVPPVVEGALSNFYDVGIDEYGREYIWTTIAQQPWSNNYDLSKLSEWSISHGGDYETLSDASAFQFLTDNRPCILEVTSTSNINETMLLRPEQSTIGGGSSIFRVMRGFKTSDSNYKDSNSNIPNGTAIRITSVNNDDYYTTGIGAFEYLGFTFNNFSQIYGSEDDFDETDYYYVPSNTNFNESEHGWMWAAHNFKTYDLSLFEDGLQGLLSTPRWNASNPDHSMYPPNWSGLAEDLPRESGAYCIIAEQSFDYNGSTYIFKPELVYISYNISNSGNPYCKIFRAASGLPTVDTQEWMAGGQIIWSAPWVAMPDGASVYTMTGNANTALNDAYPNGYNFQSPYQNMAGQGNNNNANPMGRHSHSLVFYNVLPTGYNPLTGEYNPPF